MSEEAKPPEKHEIEVSKNLEKGEVRLYPRKVWGGREIAKYDRVVGDAVCELISQGLSPQKVSELPGMPSVMDMKRWTRHHPEFLKAFRLANEARAEFLAEKALQVADKSTWQTAKADALKIDTLKWQAEKLDPEGYGSAKKQGDVTNNSLTFIIQTGIERPGEASTLRPIEIETRDPSLVLKEEATKEVVDAEVMEDGSEPQDH